MAITAPTQLAVKSANTNGQTSSVLNLGAGIPAGAEVVCLFINAGGSGYATAASDDHGNAYTRIDHASRNSQNWCSSARFRYATAPGQTTLTVTHPSSNEVFAWVGYHEGDDATAPKDSDGANNAFATSLAVTTQNPANLTADDEISYAFCSVGFGTAPTVAGYTSLSAPADGVRIFAGRFAYRLLSGGSGAPETATFTTSGSRQLAAGILTFKPAAGGPTQQEASGTAAVATTATASATARSERTGTAAATFGATGSATARTAATGTTAVSVAASATATTQAQASGTSSVTVGATGAATATSRPNTTATVTVTASAAATARTETTGAVSVTVTAAGAATALTRAAGAAAVTIGVSGTATVPGQISATGTAAINTSTTGAATARTAAAGTASVATTATGAATVRPQAAGQAGLAFTASGTASQPTLVSAAGIAAITVTTVADAAARTLAAATAAIAFTAAGDATILGREAVIFAPLPAGRILGGQPGTGTHRSGGFIAGHVPGPAGGGTPGELVGPSRGRVHTSGVKP